MLGDAIASKKADCSQPTRKFNVTWIDFNWYFPEYFSSRYFPKYCSRYFQGHLNWFDLTEKRCYEEGKQHPASQIRKFWFFSFKEFFFPLLRGQAMWFRVWYLGPTRPSCLEHVIYDGAQTVIWRATFFTDSFYFLIYYHPLSQWMYTSHLRNISSYSF